MIATFHKIKNWFIADILKSTDDFYEKARVNLIFDFPFFMVFIGTVACSVFFILNLKFSYAAIIGGVAFCSLLLFYLKFSKSVFLSSLIYATVLLLIIVLNLYFNHKLLHLGFPFWLAIIILFATFNLNYKIGLVIGLIGSAAFVIYRQFFLYQGLEASKANPVEHFPAFMIELIIVLFLLLYLIYIYLLTSRKSETALITKNKQLHEKNELIHSQSEEKTIMLREIHHRVKNNLQVIKSILRLQSMDIEDPKIQEIFELSQKRIVAMSLIHERLYQLERINNDIAPSYLPELVKDLIELYSANHKIKLEIQIDHGFINQKNIVPFGLIVNELVSNSLKHGFKQAGTITILGHSNQQYFHFSYADNGKGLDAEFKKSFGMELIDSLTDQLDGSFEIHSKEKIGTQFEFRFPITKQVLE